ncbi:MAG: hypothetical protein C4334_15085 [Pyrinomonas sp.]
MREDVGEAQVTEMLRYELIEDKTRDDLLMFIAALEGVQALRPETLKLQDTLVDVHRGARRSSSVATAHCSRQTSRSWSRAHPDGST